MSTEAITSLVLQVIGMLGSFAIVLWKFTESQNRKLEHAIKSQNAIFSLQAEQQTKAINRVYERMDERADEANKVFVRLDVHNLTMQHLDQKTDEKFKTTIETFELKMQALTKAVTDAIARMK